MVDQGTNRNRSATRKQADTLHAVGGQSILRAASASPTPVRSLQDSPGLRALISDMPSAIALFDRDLKTLSQNHIPQFDASVPEHGRGQVDEREVVR